MLTFGKLLCQQSTSFIVSKVPFFLLEAFHSFNDHTKQLSQSQEDQENQ